MAGMNLPATLPSDLATRLSAHAARLGAMSPAELFRDAAGRVGPLATEGEGLLLDFTRQRLDAAALQDLLAWADACGLQGRIEALFAGKHVNHTEDRAALHVALRASAADGPIPADKRALVAAERDKLRAFVAEVRSGKRRGHAGQPFMDVLNIGIGGSDLGPVMAYEALGQVREQLEDRTGRRLRTHFASNIDGT